MALPATGVPDGVLIQLGDRHPAALATGQRPGRGCLSRWLRERFEYLAAATLLWILEKLPQDAAVWLAERAGMAAGRVVCRWGSVAEGNLRLALPGMDGEARRAVIVGVYRSLGRVAFALGKIRAWSESDIREHVRFVGMENFHKASAKGRGVLLLTAHLGNWELGALAHGVVAGPMSVVVRPFKNRLLDRLVESRRRAHGNRVISKRNAAREILRELAANRTVGILADQHASREEAVEVRFFGLRASANRVVAQLAMRSGAAVVPAAARWAASQKRHVVTYLSEVELVRSDDAVRDVAVNTQRFQSVLEALIRKTPEQWLWIHRRWRR